MQLGVRWPAGDAPHRSVPPLLHDAIAEQEAVHPGASAWTLTWLEGRPRAALDDLVVLGVDAAGRVGAVDATERPDAPGGHSDDDDDWLN